jgi:predicted lipoprotein with Yx(FWY)xxD motif
MRRLVLAVSTMAAAAVLSACSSSGGGSAASSPSSAPSAAASAAAAPAPAASTAAASAAGTVKVTQGALGTFLVDGGGHTLYLYTADQGTTSSCTGGCATAWPPLTTTGAPQAGAGVKASLLGTTTRPDGTHQITYNGHPLYTYAEDSGAGATTGQGEGGVWYVLNPAGTAITKS